MPVMPLTPLKTAAPEDEGLRRLKWLGYFLDDAIRIPGVGYRIGYDAVIGWGPLLLLLGLGAELVILCVVPWCGFFRRSIDAQLDEVDRAAWSRAREPLIRQMDIRHQQELARLDRLSCGNGASCQ